MHRRWFAYVGLVFGFVLSVTMGQRLEAQTITPLCVSGCVTDYQVTVTPDGTNAGNKTLSTSGYTAVFTVKNTGALADTYSLNCINPILTICGGVSPSSVSLASGATANVTLTYSTGAVLGAGQVKLKATSTLNDNFDSGYYTLTVTGTYPQGPPGLAALPRNRPDQLERGLCLTAGAGEAAWQCGDLIVAHAMPAYRTLGRDRSLALVYNSATAAPRPTVAVTVTAPAGILTPPSVVAELSVGPSGGSQTLRASATFNAWGTGASAVARQIALSYDASNALVNPTGIYDYTLVVKNNYATAQSATMTGKLIVVNRSGSRFGQGWALAGVERIYPAGTGPILWVAGDGSARIYTPVTTNVWVAPAAAYRDTLRYSTGTTQYTRTLRHGVTVTYDATGRHITTTNRVTQPTTFTWGGTGDSLVSIAVPPVGVGGSYQIVYDGTTSGKVDKLRDPGPSGGRALDLTVNTTTGQLTGILDPDSRSVGFGYDATTKAMTSRTNRQNYATTFWYGPSLKVDSVRVPYGASGGSIASTVFQPWDEKGLAVGTGNTGKVAVDTGSVLTTIFGPRGPSIADDATISVDRWGAPTKTINALGTVTTVERADTARPALVTKMTYATGRVVNMTYDARGNLLTVNDLTDNLTYGGLSIGTPNKRTTYEYLSPNTKDSPSKITTLGRANALSYTYNSLGLTATAIDARGHQTTFTYQPSGSLTGQLIEARENAVWAWREPTQDSVVADQVTTLEYDTKGNPSRTISPVGVATSYVNNALGLPSDIYDAMSVRTRVAYDAMGRDTLSSSYLTQVPPPQGNPLAACNAQVVTCSNALQPGGTGFPEERQTRTVHMLLADSLVDPRGVRRTIKYDASGAVTAEVDEFGNSNALTYDAAGLLATSTARSGELTQFSYDLLGRRTRIQFPSRSYTDEINHINPPFDTIWNPNQVAKADDIQTAYDALGLTETHTNRNGTLKRWFNADGSLRKQTWQPTGFDQAGVGSPGNWTDEIEYAYDAAGARAVMRHNADSVVYTYAGSGDLQSMRVRFGKDVALANPNRIFTFAWDQLGRRHEIVYPIFYNGQAMRVTWQYDAAGNLRRLDSFHARGASVNTLRLTLRNQTVDPLGHTTLQTMQCPYSGTAPSGGNPCGGVEIATSTANRYSVQGWLVKQGSDSMRYDMSGNLVRRSSTSTDSTIFDVYPHPDLAPSPASNRLWRSTQGSYRTIYVNDINGARVREYQWPVSGVSTYRYWYDGLGRPTGSIDIFHGSSSNYGADACGYDPLGNMVKPCQTSQPVLTLDGANVVGSGRPGGNSVQNPAWSFVHGPGTDDPLIGVYNNGNVSYPTYTIFYYVTDGAGRHLAVGDTSGFLTPGMYADYNERGGVYAGGTSSGFSFGASRFDGGATPSRSSFFRNRIYDQGTGRWTQEDPIGVAGGINLYQFNGNDPASNTDPFGLCPDACVLETAAVIAVAPLIKAAVVGAVLAGAAYAGSKSDQIGTWFRKKTDAIRKEWEKLNGQPWPADPTGRPHDADHDNPLADGGSDTADNVTPRPHNEHVQRHKDRGDFRRWGRRAQEQPQGEAEGGSSASGNNAP